MSVLRDTPRLQFVCSIVHCYADVLRAFDLSLTDGNYVRLQKYIDEAKIDTSHFLGRSIPEKWKQYPLRAFVNQSMSVSDVLRKMGLTVHGDNAKTFHSYAQAYNIDTSHFDRITQSKARLSDERLFCESSTADRSIVKRVIIARQLLPYRCTECPCDGNWNGKPIVLQLEHKNGINNDNRLENLTFLCPNCHSQTPTFAGKNKKLSNA